MFGKRFSRALAVTSVASLVLATAAFADTVSTNDLANVSGTRTAYATIPAEDATTPAQETSTFSVEYRLNSTAGDGGPTGSSGTCNVSVANPGALSFSNLPAGVSASGGLSWTACGDQDVTFTVSSSAVAGTYTGITPTMSGGQGTYTYHQDAIFSLVLSTPSAPANNAPTVTVANATVAVVEGTEATNSGTYGDADGDSVTVSASLGTLSDNGDGTWSWARTDGDDVAATTVTITADDGTDETTASFSYSVSNADPTLNTPTFSYNPYSGAASASILFADAGWLDSHSASFDWAGTPATGVLSNNENAAPDATGKFSSTHTFAANQCIAGAVGVTVSDDDLGSASHEFAAAGSLERYTATFKAPLKDGYKNIAKLGNVIPVKIEILDCNGDPVTDRTLTIRLIKGNTTDETETGAVVVDATSVSSADTDNVMRLADGFYIYNLATKGLATGTPFTILVKDGNNLVNSALIELKK